MNLKIVKIAKKVYGDNTISTGKKNMIKTNSNLKEYKISKTKKETGKNI